MNKPTPLYPAILQFSGQSELGFMLSEDDRCINDPRHFIRPSDRLIDSHGQIFRIHDGGWQAENELISLAELIETIRCHISQDGQCCVAKFSATSIAEAIQFACGLERDAA